MQAYYLTQDRFGLRFLGDCGVEGRSARIFVCALCDMAVLICSRCDRGQRYCCEAHRQEARRNRQRVANARWQSSLRGRRKHAERARRYRARKIAVRHEAFNQVDDRGGHHDTEHHHASEKIVTYRGCQTQQPDDLVRAASVVGRRQSSGRWPGKPIVRCHFCGRRCLRRIRRAFLRRRGRAHCTVRRGRGSDL